MEGPRFTECSVLVGDHDEWLLDGSTLEVTCKGCLRKLERDFNRSWSEEGSR